MVKYEVGALVRHPQCPDWGLGKVVGAAGPTLSIFFRGASGTTVAEVVKRISVAQHSLDIVPEQSDPWLDNLALDASGKPLVTRRRLHFDEALRRFREVHPDGFAEPTLGSRAAASRAHESLQTILDSDTQTDEGELEKAFGTVMDAAEEAALVRAGDTAALRGALASRTGAKAVRTSLRRLVRAAWPPAGQFAAFVAAMRRLLPDEQPRRDAWPVTTLLPFLALPERFGILRVAETRAVGEMLMFGLHFDPSPNWRTYALFLRLGDGLRVDLAARGLEPRDWQDLHSFIWTLGALRKPKAA
jgi:hypothetical protein